MFVVRKKGYGDIVPLLLCDACRKELPLNQAWLGFVPLSDEQPQSEGIWLHQRCSNGRVKTLFKSRRMLLWRGFDLFQKLLRQTEPPRVKGRA